MSARTQTRRALAAAAARLLGPVAPRECLLCGRGVRRPTGAQQAQTAAGWAPSCGHCGGLMLPAMDLAIARCSFERLESQAQTRRP